MKSLTLVLAALALWTSGNLSAQNSSDAVSLFASAQLDDWDFFLADPTLVKSDVWEFRDGGILFCKGVPFGWLGTKKEYRNFHLTVEYRWPDGAPPSNSGVFLRIAGEPAALPQCVECQLAAGKAGDLYGFGGRKISGSSDRSDVVTGKIGTYYAVFGLVRNEKPAGEWNQLEIVCQDGTIVIVLNGRLVNWTLDAEAPAGKLGFQSEGGPIEFRNPHLTELP